ncbi:MAG: aldose epimerase [Opitutales bacterium]|nr:aldose epimerase [Opitutales bacterium]
MEIIDFNGEKLYKWTVGASTFIANPRRGARLMNWFLTLADGSQRDVIYWPENADFSGDFASIRGGNPILFPFCGRSHVEGGAGKWKTPEGRILNMPQHGYARQGEFEVVDCTDFALVAKFKPSEECKTNYPYDYDFTVTYRFNEFSLLCGLSLSNNSDIKIPWSAGHHFYFKMPWHDGASRKNYRILCDAKKAFRLDGRGALQTAEANFPADFSDPDLWNRISCKLKTNIVKFGPKSGEEDVTIRVGESERPDAWTSVVTWTESDESPFYCVEPWMGAPNCAEHGGGLNFVSPHSTQSFAVDISVF